MVRLIQEELHHFEQVLEIMQARDIPYGPVTASRYARNLMQHVRTHEPATIVDKLIIGAYIEARLRAVCQAGAPSGRGAGAFLRLLAALEARHYQDYLALAEQYAGRTSVNGWPSSARWRRS